LHTLDLGALGIDEVAAIAGNANPIATAATTAEPVAAAAGSAEPVAAAAFHRSPRTGLERWCGLRSEEVMPALESGRIGPATDRRSTRGGLEFGTALADGEILG